MADVGITSYGVYVPRYRLNRKTISNAMGWLSPGGLAGDKAVANHDEDSLSMAVNAGMNCLKGNNKPPKIESVFFASTTIPNRERESATIIAGALDLGTNVRTADFASSLKAGTTSLLSAWDSVKGGKVKGSLVCSGDCRLGKPGSSMESLFGDGAAAFVLGSTGVIASLDDSYSVSYDFPDYRRSADDKFVRNVEDRFIREEGYNKFIAEAISGLLKKAKLEAKDIAKIAFPCLNAREHAGIGTKLGLNPTQLQEPLLNVMGEAGTASPLLLLAAMLDEAKPGDKLIVASYGSGAEALLFEVTEEIDKCQTRGLLKRYLAAKRDLPSYEKYLAFRNILPVELTGGNTDVAPTQLSLAWRERKAVLGLYGSICKRCGTPQYPPQRVCVNPACGAIDEMADYRFADKKGNVFTYTADYKTVSLDAPMFDALIDFEGGGRFIFELTDCDFSDLKIGMPVGMTFRRKYYDESRGIVGYFWKAIPIK